MLKIDNRESPEVIEEIRKLGIPFEIVQLEVGDFVYDNISIERKSGQDFVSSLIDGRLKDQIFNMEANYDRTFLIIHGSPFLSLANVHEHAILGMLSSIAVRTKTKILQVDTLSDFAYLCKSIIEKCQDNKPFTASQVVKRNALDAAIRILSQIDGISTVKARAILEHFKTLRAVILANKEKLMEIKGIGPKLAENISKTFMDDAI